MAAGLFLALSLSTFAQDPRPDRVTPVAPHFEAIELERLDPGPGFRFEYWEAWSISDDGTVYGSLYGETAFRMFVSRPNDGTSWLIDGEPDDVEARPVAASTSGIALIYTVFHWPQDWVHVPGRGTFEMNSLHPDDFLVQDMNNQHVFAGWVDLPPDNRAVTWSQNEGFVYLADEFSLGMAINDQGTVLVMFRRIAGEIPMRVMYEDGTAIDFILPDPYSVGISVGGINERNEIAGRHARDEGEWTGWAGWYWSEEKGFMEIPVLHTTRYDLDVQIYGISDAGWVLGNQIYFDGEDFLGDYFLWHPDSGFFHLRDLYNWQDDYYDEGEMTGWAVINADGQIAVTNCRLSDGKYVIVFLDPIR